MLQSIVHIALVVRDYDEAIDFYTNRLHFTLIDDSYQPEQDKRWVVVSGGTTGRCTCGESALSGSPKRRTMAPGQSLRICMATGGI